MDEEERVGDVPKMPRIQRGGSAVGWVMRVLVSIWPHRRGRGLLQIYGTAHC